MNLSARLGTAANLGLLDQRSSRRSIIVGNMVLLQVQALLVAAVAATLAFVLGLALPEREKMPMEMPQDSSRGNSTSSRLVRQLVRQLVTRQLEPETLKKQRTLASWFKE